MKRLLWVVFFFACWAPAQTLPNAPSSANPDRNAFTFIRYDLNLTIDPAKSSLMATGIITIRNDSSFSQQVVALQISSQLKWSSVKIGGKPVQFRSKRLVSDADHTGALNEMTFMLPQPIAPAASLNLEIAYSGPIAKDATRLTNLGMPSEKALSSDWDSISERFTALRGAGHVAWYPMAMQPVSLDQGNETFTALGQFRHRNAGSSMKIELTVEQPAGHSLQIVSNSISRPESSVRSEHGILTARLDFPRIGEEGPVMVLGEFSTTQNSASTIFATEKNSVGEKYAETAMKLVPQVSQWIRPMQKKIQVIQNPDDNSAPFESGTLLITPFKGSEKLIQFQLAHTLAHSAIYSSRPWINEGLAHYAQVRMREAQDGRKAAIASLLDRLGALSLSEPAEGTSPDSTRNLIGSGDEVLYRTKAMFVWWMLHDMIGDEALARALKEYRPDEDKEPSYVQRLIEAQAHMDLDWFFSDWVYRDRGLPDFRITSVYPRRNLSGGYLVTVTVENLGDAGAEVPIAVVTQEGTVVTKLQVRSKEKASARVNTMSLPSEVVVNDGSVPESDMNNNVFKVGPPKQ